MPDYLSMEFRRACAFTGHREIGESFNADLLKSTVRKFIEEGFVDFYCGMAIGFDLLAADAVLEEKKSHPNVRLVACIPCRNQQKNFPINEKNNYERIIGLCDKVEILSESYYRGCMLARDRFMVDNCDRVLAYLDRSEGGTAYTVKYAKSKNKEIYLI